MNYWNLFTIMLAATCCMTVMAEDQRTGEYAYTFNGEPACIGQATMDHLFVRGSYNSSSFDNVVAFDEGDTKLVWLWLDDDEIYHNDKVQALTPIPYDSQGNRYSEITYSSFQCKIYLPENITLVRGIDPDGNKVRHIEGDRLPLSSTFSYMENEAIELDGVNYRVYTLVCNNVNQYGSHFSAMDECLYQSHGALKKDDAPLVGLFLRNNKPNIETGQMPDMIIAHQEFGFTEAFTTEPEWEPNEYRFVFGTGGNNQSQRFEYYNRVKLYGSGDFLISETPVISYQINDREVLIMATGNGVVELKIDGVTVENPYTIMRGTQALTVVATATAQEEGKALSDEATMTITIPAREIMDFFTVPSSSVMFGQELEIPVSMDNADDIVAFQADISLPEGFVLKSYDTQSYAVTPSGRISANHVLMTSDLPTGEVRVLCYSPGVNLINGHDSELFYFTVLVPDDAQGDYVITLKNILLTTDELEEIRLEDALATVHVMTYLAGDANGNGEITVTDVVTTAWEALMLNPEPFVFEAADMNHDGIITVTDVTWIAHIILHPESTANMHLLSSLTTDDVMSGKVVRHLRSGETAPVGVILKNEKDYTAFQLDMRLPVGVAVSNFSLSGRNIAHCLETNMLDDGTLRVLCYSPALDVIAAGEGVVLSFDVTALAEVDKENIHVTGIELTTPACQAVKLADFNIGVNMPSTIWVDEADIDQPLRVTARGRDIIVDSPTGQAVTITDVTGRAMTVSVEAGRTVIPMSHTGVYIVTDGKLATKLMLR